MTAETKSPHSSPDTSTAPPIQVTESGRVALEFFEREIAAYLRELPRLLKEGQAWRHALVKGDELLGIWDSDGEAIEAGCDRFGLETFYVKRIDPRDPERFALLEQWKKSQCPS